MKEIKPEDLKGLKFNWSVDTSKIEYEQLLQDASMLNYCEGEMDWAGYTSDIKSLLRETVIYIIGENEEEFVEAKDNDCHRYKIPKDKEDDWYKWLEIDEDDERSWDVPDYAERLDGEYLEDNVGRNILREEQLERLNKII